jgi:hypothetical protein
VRGAFMLSHIFLFGHRQQHGKDTSCNILQELFKEKNIPFCRTYFAKLLKAQVATKYNLDFLQMESNDYKMTRPPHLNGLSVRDVLIKEGCASRAIWGDVWANSVYQEILNSDAKIGFVSDYRYPNEYSSFDRSFDYWSGVQTKHNSPVKPKILRVLVHRPDGIFKNDGADGELPDIEAPEAWDYIIVNDSKGNWLAELRNKVTDIMEKEKII